MTETPRPLSNVEQLMEDLQEALSLSSAYREAAEKIKSAQLYHSVICNMQLGAATYCNCGLADLMHILKQDKPLDRWAEEPVGRDELANMMQEVEKIWETQGYKPQLVYMVTDHLLKTFRVERR